VRLRTGIAPSYSCARGGGVNCPCGAGARPACVCHQCACRAPMASPSGWRPRRFLFAPCTMQLKTQTTKVLRFVLPCVLSAEPALPVAVARESPGLWPTVWLVMCGTWYVVHQQAPCWTMWNY
jgi:hypothetical protein